MSPIATPFQGVMHDTLTRTRNLIDRVVLSYVCDITFYDSIMQH